MSLFWNSSELKQIHIELTNACNAACPMCVRFYNNSPYVRPDLEIGQITLEKFKQYFPPDIVKQLNMILFCGVHGDPCVAKDFYEICEYIDEVSNCTVMVNSNAGMRSSDWWSKLGKLFSKNKTKNWRFTFSIDGLEDTNHLYRRNVKWNTLKENVNAFTQWGVKSDWDFLIFEHNEHQIEEAKQVSKEWNIENFVAKKSLGVDDGSKLKAMPAMSKEGDVDYWILPPKNPQNRNLENPEKDEIVYESYPFNVADYKEQKKRKIKNKWFLQRIKTVYDEFAQTDTSQWDHSKIECKSKLWSGGKEIFVDNFGRVMPCCYVGTHLNGTYTDPRTLQLHKHMNDYGWNYFNLNNFTLKEILDNGHLDRVFADTWNIGEVKCGRMAYCADTCGKFSSIDKIWTHEENESKSKYNQPESKK